MFENLWKKEEYPPKVVAMNEAVIALLQEGNDLSHLRVSEITKRAGIGKGTAYEYFSSKEEIIVTALQYDLAKQLDTLLALEERAEGFRDMLEKLMFWMSDNFKNNAGFTLLFQANMNIKEVPSGISEKLKQQCPGIDAIYHMIEPALVLGEQEGVIKKMDHYFGAMAIISQVMTYSLYLARPDSIDGPSEKEVSEFAVNIIIKMLN